MEAVNAYLRELESDPARVRFLVSTVTGSITTSCDRPHSYRLLLSELV